MFVCSNPFAIKCYRAMTFSIYFLLIYFNAQTMLRVTIKLMMFLIELEEHWYNMTQYFPGVSLVFLLFLFILSIVLAFPNSSLFSSVLANIDIFWKWANHIQYALNVFPHSIDIWCYRSETNFFFLIFYFSFFFVESNPHNRLWNSDMYYSSTVWIFKKGLTRNLNIYIEKRSKTNTKK